MSDYLAKWTVVRHTYLHSVVLLFRNYGSGFLIYDTENIIGAKSFSFLPLLSQERHTFISNHIYRVIPLANVYEFF